MKKIQYLYLLILAAVIMLPISCSDLLDTKPQGSVLQGNFPTTAADALQVTNAAYASLRDVAWDFGSYPITDIMSDDARKGSNPQDQFATVGPYDNFNINANQDGLNRWWNQLYQAVKTANVAINTIPSIQMDAALKTRYVAEARFLRALSYFDMVRAWGGVPIVTTLTPAVGLTRSSADSVYALVERDLLFAAANLPERDAYPAADLGRATTGAAKGFLAKMYLFRKDFVNAEKYALQVINSNKYGLETDFNNANQLPGNFGTESLFEVGATSTENNDTGGAQYANIQGIRGTPNRGWGFNRPTIDLKNSFEKHDPRMQATIIFLGETLAGVLTVGDGSTPDVTLDGADTVEIECYNQKTWIPGNNTISSWGYHRRLLRYADVLLMAAEASNENSKPAQALTYTNMVRARARSGNATILPDLTATDKAVLRNLIMTERRHELAMEGHRFWDLVRTGMAPAILGPHGFVTGKHELLPIPQQQIDLSNHVLTQNPNY